MILPSRINHLFLVFLALSLSSLGLGQDVQKDESTEWLPARFLNLESNNKQILGSPALVNSPYGDALEFNGTGDAIFINDMPLASMDEFTLEVIFRPDTCSPFEQRFLHIGDVSGDRVLLELRALDNKWYFDGFVASKGVKKALIDEALTHPLGQWYHVALVVEANRLTTYVNGVKELSESYSFKGIQKGQTSIGVRQNKVSWFKGSIYKIKITAKQLHPQEFMIN